MKDTKVAQFKQDLSARLGRLCSMHERPSEHAACLLWRLRNSVDLDAERIADEIKCDSDGSSDYLKGQALDDLETIRATFTGVIDQLRERVEHAVNSDSADKYACLRAQVDQLDDGNLEEAYVKLALEIEEETSRLEERILGGIGIFYVPTEGKRNLGNLFYLADFYLSQDEIAALDSFRQAHEANGFSNNLARIHKEIGGYLNRSLLVSVEKPRALSKRSAVIDHLALYLTAKTRSTPQLIFVGKCETFPPGFSSERIRKYDDVASLIRSHRLIKEILKSEDLVGIEAAADDFELVGSYFHIKLANVELKSLDWLTSNSTKQLEMLELTNVKFERFDQDVLAKCTGLYSLILNETGPTDAAHFNLDFLAPLVRLRSLTLTLPDQTVDLSVLSKLINLKYLSLIGAAKTGRTRLPEAASKQIFTAQSRIKVCLMLKHLEIEAIDQDATEDLQSLEIHHCIIGRVHPKAFNGSTRSPLEYVHFNEVQTPPLRVEIFATASCLTLRSVNLEALNAASFRQFFALKRLEMINCQIEELPRGALSGLKELNSVDLSNNRLQRLEQSVFDQLAGLYNVKLAGNPIETIDSNAFSACNKLNLLVLTDCRIKSIDGQLNGLEGLTGLDLTGNPVAFIAPGAFSNCPNLADLKLKNGALESLNCSMFAGLSSLQILDLSGNRISSIDVTEQHLFKDSVRLKKLDMSRNKLNKMDLTWLSNLEKLTVLDLASNLIEELTPGELPGLQALDLASNKLQTLSDVFFHSIAALKKLDLSRNDLKMTITDSTFLKQRSSLRELNLLENPSLSVTARLPLGLVRLGCDVSVRLTGLNSLVHLSLKDSDLNALEAFFRENSHALRHLISLSVRSSSIQNLDLLRQVDLKSLRHLDLADNKMETLDEPKAFADMPKLVSINLSHNGLKRIGHGVFDGLVKLRSLVLSRNSLGDADIGFHGNGKLVRIELAGNAIA